MLYFSFEFGAFFTLIFLLYWFVFDGKTKQQNILLLLASYFFYGWWDWRFLSLIVFSSLVDYVTGLMLHQSSEQSRRKAWLILSLVVNLGLLGVFKYYGFFVDSFVDLVGMFGYQIPGRTLEIILPVGISFYTFQSMSYSIDIYRKEVEPTRDLAAFLLYVSFFAQLVAGPIERATRLLPQVLRGRKFSVDNAKDGLRQILYGVFKKVVIADTIGEHILPYMLDPWGVKGSVLLVTMYLFSFQLYFDFSGYSDIACGVARMLGFKLVRNFKLFYIVRSVPEFWDRWHISMTTWFRDYVFYPLYGGRIIRNRVRGAFALVGTFVLSGLWHGAAWGFVFWGFLQGLLHIPYLLFPSLRPKRYSANHHYTLSNWVVDAGHVALTTVILALTVVFFALPEWSKATAYYSHMLTPSLFSIPWTFKLLLPGVYVVCFFEWLQDRRGTDHTLQIGHIPVAIRWTVYYVLTLLVLYYNYDRQSFIYFQF